MVAELRRWIAAQTERRSPVLRVVALYADSLERTASRRCGKSAWKHARRWCVKGCIESQAGHTHTDVFESHTAISRALETAVETVLTMVRIRVGIAEE